MHIKRFEAPTMAEALARVKSELGPDALILSSRTIRRGRHVFGLMGRTMVEVQAARERGSGKSTIASVGPTIVKRLDHDEPVYAADALLTDLRRELTLLRGRESFEEEVRSELRGLRRALGGVLGAGLRGAADPLVESVSRAGLDWMHAESLVSKWRESGGAGGQSSLEALLATRIEAKLVPPRVDKKSGVRVLVGAPGVGKTTTLAKLAARNEEGEREVVLVSLDHFRIGATDQLRRYAELLDSPFREVAGAAELPEVIARYRGYSVLVDTAGRGQCAEVGLEPLLALREVLGKEISVELVIDATARREVQRAQISRFSALQPDRIILAKTDESESLIDLTNLLLDPDCPPLCWIGTGQRVPEDLALVEARHLAREALGEAA